MARDGTTLYSFTVPSNRAKSYDTNGTFIMRTIRSNNILVTFAYFIAQRMWGIIDLAGNAYFLSPNSMNQSWGKSVFFRIKMYFQEAHLVIRRKMRDIGKPQIRESVPLYSMKRPFFLSLSLRRSLFAG